jgi:hypothetical protein
MESGVIAEYVSRMAMPQHLVEDYSQMDAALAYLSDYGPDLSNGFTNHAPMVTEALAAMGRADAVMPWLTKNWPLRDLMMPRLSATDGISADGWQDALGNDRPLDWAAFFEKELARARWQDVVAKWTARLAPGVESGAAHGVIRVGHAVRSLAQDETPLRLRELADAFGYWASCYETLPDSSSPPPCGGEQQQRTSGERSDPGGGPLTATPSPTRRAKRASTSPQGGGDNCGCHLSPREAIGLVPFSPGDARITRGGFTTGLRSLHQFAGFAPVIGMIDVTGDPAQILSGLTETFARVYLANAFDDYTVIAFIHGVTGCVALRSLAPYLDADTVRAALRYAWQTGAALYAVYGTAKPDWTDAAAPKETPQQLIGLAVETADDHAIKFTEACLREYALSPDPVYLAAARHAIAILG